MQLESQRLFKQHMSQILKKKPWIADHREFGVPFIDSRTHCMSVIPDFGVTCRRLTPGPGYLEAIQADNVGFQSIVCSENVPNYLTG